MGVEESSAISPTKQNAELVYPGHLKLDVSLCAKGATVTLVCCSLFLFYHIPLKPVILLVGRNWSLSVEAEKNLSPSCHIDFSSQELSLCSKAILPRLCFVSLGVSLS